MSKLIIRNAKGEIVQEMVNGKMTIDKTIKPNPKTCLDDKTFDEVCKWVGL